MSIDLSHVKGLADSVKGNIKRIIDENNNVLWDAVKPIVTVTITLPTTSYTGLCNVVIDGITYPNEEYPSGTVTLDVEMGTKITCNVWFDAETAAAGNLSTIYGAYVQVNALKVLEGESLCSHTFTADSNVSIYMSAHAYYASSKYNPYAGYAQIEYVKSNSFFLRPSADIDVVISDTSVLKCIPADATSAYMLINEEVSDGEATYIYVEDSGATSTPVFAFSGSVPKDFTRATNVYFVFSGEASGESESSYLLPSLAIDSVIYSAFAGGRSCFLSGTNYAPKNAYVQNKLVNGTYTSITGADIAADITPYLLSSGLSFTAQMSIQMDAASPEGSKENGYVYLSQAFIVIEYE